MATSVEKLPQLVEQLASTIPAPYSLMVPQLMPLAMGSIPQDPAELDGAITQLAQQLLDLRSDDAHALAVLPLDGVTTAEAIEARHA